MDFVQKDTLKVMLAGLAFAIASNVFSFGLIIERYWEWSFALPFAWLTAGLSYMITFFHELGHTICAWYYGYFTIPMFDFKHGGGWSASFGGQNMLILLGVWGALGYGIYKLRGFRISQAFLIVLLLINVLTAFHDVHHRAIIFFMGPMSEGVIAAFLLYRALLDLAPRGWLERFLNAGFGFAIFFHVWAEGYGLLNNDVKRSLYLKQKSGHGAGDFDQIAGRYVSFDFSDVITLWCVLVGMCFVVPFVIYGYCEYRRHVFVGADFDEGES